MCTTPAQRLHLKILTMADRLVLPAISSTTSKRDPENSPEYSELLYLRGNRCDRLLQFTSEGRSLHRNQTHPNRAHSPQKANPDSSTEQLGTRTSFHGLVREHAHFTCALHTYLQYFTLLFTVGTTFRRSAQAVHYSIGLHATSAGTRVPLRPRSHACISKPHMYGTHAAPTHARARLNLQALQTTF